MLGPNLCWDLLKICHSLVRDVAKLEVSNKLINNKESKIVTYAHESEDKLWAHSGSNYESSELMHWIKAKLGTHLAMQEGMDATDLGYSINRYMVLRRGQFWVLRGTWKFWELLGFLGEQCRHWREVQEKGEKWS